MKRNLFNTLLAALFVVILSATTFAQDGRLSEKKYAEWLVSSPQNQRLTTRPGYLAAVAVASRYETKGVSIDLSIFAGENLNSMPEMEVLVQPMKITQSADGKKETIAVGSVSRIQSSGSVNVVRGLNGLISQPQIIAPIPQEADAVQVIVKGVSGKPFEMSLVLPLKDEPTIGQMTRLFL